MSTSTILPGPELHPRSLRYGSPTAATPSQQAPAAPLAGVVTIPAPASTLRSEFLHDTCPECGWDGDAALVIDPEAGVIGWECPDCRTFVTTQDLEDA